MSNENDHIQARLGTNPEEENQFKNSDPFNKSWDELKTLDGIQENFKRRVTRQVNKAVAAGGYLATNANVNLLSSAYLDSASADSKGIKDTGSKSINPGLVYRNGYGLFDVITPPYNMYELANFYDTSFANHAAIDAKVENVVGLGYRFDVTDRTALSLESNDNQEAVGRARKRIERARLELREWMESLNDDDSFTRTMEKVLQIYSLLEMDILKLEEL